MFLSSQLLSGGGLKIRSFKKIFQGPNPRRVLQELLMWPRSFPLKEGMAPSSVAYADSCAKMFIAASCDPDMRRKEIKNI